MNSRKRSESPSPTFQQFVEAIDDAAIYMLDGEGRVMSWSPAAARINGWRREEVEGQSFRRFFTPEDQQARVPEAILVRARAEGRVQSEGWRLRKNGERFWAQASLHAIRDDSGAVVGFAKITRDMTQPRAAQQALIESERRFRYLVEGVVDYAIYMLDPNGVVVNWNRGAERAKGYKAEEIIGRHFSTFYTAEDRRAGVPALVLERALAEGRWETEGWRVRKDGSRFWASVVVDAIHDDQGRHIGFTKITRDISERQAAQEALAQSERQFRMLVAGVVDYALIMLDPNGVITNWNAGAENIKGYQADEIIGRHISIFYTEADRAAGEPARALLTAIDQGRYEAEAWRVRKDGSLFWANVVLDTIRDEHGELVGFAKITRDITERRNAQIELHAAHERLAQAQKMEAIGQLTGGVAHDFNNLLMVVVGQTQLLRRRLGDDPRAAKALDAIEIASRRGQDLTRQLLAFARRQRLNPIVLSLHARAEDLSQLLGASVGRGVALRIDIPEGIWPVEADAGELELALLNLAVNARDAMPNGGSLTVLAQNVRLKRGEIDREIAGDHVAVTVRDTGVGIPPDILARVFEPFFTTKEVNRGTGLGLSQVYGFVEQSGGRATVTSELGAGASFTLYLPRSTKPLGTVSPPPEAEAPRGVRVLVVEDNPEVAEVAAGLLEQLGSRPRVVASADAALRVLLEGERPDVIFSDIVMAGEMDGLALARRVRAEWPDVPILLTSGYSHNAEKAAQEFVILPKPYQLADLSRALGVVLDQPPEPIPSH
ncbi:MAG TPA: PAS domain S-box protein [Phenylobacterium sp.]|uniref:PAS domain S-box protein n=1 Tax=Phenylobacterium sp. TaxID=1871053 RepID=UPI002B493363|nr:PAS domain S-box protein [Phenylobacterium sp.]HKR89276.1 PAS domain S-box protein [Phenylobacterium sp.]